MKKIFTTLAALLLTIGAMAVPAKPGAFDYVQPDGSVIKLELHGDEFFSWHTLAGTTQVVALDKDGFWQRTTISPAARQMAREVRRLANELRVQQGFRSKGPRTHTGNIMTHGERHIPVLLIAYSDVDFTLSNPNERFNAMLNAKGYSENGGTGSVQDYFVDNSHGQFRPVFDVYGPVKLDKTMSYYGANETYDNGYINKSPKASEALYDACDKLNATVDFSKYDYDNDGYVDMTLFYFAGYNEAEGGPADALWPHQSAGTSSTLYDGKKVSLYFCTSELKGSSGATMCGIGTTSHEFGHSLGLPDFYDTDYEENGTCSALGYFSIMCSGNYNNDGRTPPYYNVEERIYLGWMIDEDIPELPGGPVSLAPVNNEVAYRSFTDTEGEYFLYEYRDGTGWDSGLGTSGLLIYHADKSKVRSVGGLTPYEHWVEWYYYNAINAYGDHPCFYLIPSSDPANLVYDRRNLKGFPFPGEKGIRSHTPIDWEGEETGVTVSDITINTAANKATFTASYTNAKVVRGKVLDLFGKPVEGVQVIFTPKANNSAQKHPYLVRDVNAPVDDTYQALTAKDGSFRIDLTGVEVTSGRLSISKQDYKPDGVDVTLGARGASVNMTIRRKDQGDLLTFQYYDPGADKYYIGKKGTTSMMAAICIPADEFPEKGGLLNNVQFTALWDADCYYIIVDAGTERLLTYPVGVPPIRSAETFDLSDEEILIPGGTDVYIGYGIENAHTDSGYEGFFFLGNRGGNNFYMTALEKDKTTAWGESIDYRLALTATVVERTESSEPDPEVSSFAKMDVAAILDPGNGTYAAGSNFALALDIPEGSLASSTAWTLDGQGVSGASVALAAGKHVVCATVTWSDGSVETLELVLNVN